MTTSVVRPSHFCFFPFDASGMVMNTVVASPLAAVIARDKIF